MRINRGAVPGVQAVYTFEDAARAYTRVASGTVLGKIAVVPPKRSRATSAPNVAMDAAATKDGAHHEDVHA